MVSRFAAIRAGQTDGRRDRLTSAPPTHETVADLRRRIADLERERLSLIDTIGKLEARVSERDRKIAALNHDELARVAAVASYGEAAPPVVRRKGRPRKA